MKKLAIVLLALLIAGVAVARDATQLSTDLPRPAAERYAGDCVVGNSDIAGIQGYYGSWWFGPEIYAIPFNPMSEGCACGAGFSMKAVHMYLVLDEFTNMMVQGKLFAAVDDGSGCLVPGAEIYASAPMNVSGLFEPNYYDVEIPMDAPCASVGESYFMAVEFLDNNNGFSVGIPVDSTPTPCYSYNDWGSGWADLVTDIGFAGDIIMWADIDCCEDPVANENSTWGEMKNLYK
ncbi:MAG: hypothetical protein Q7W56_05900 [Candidatus Latescibacteria bacterium]|nr:hypothetical protein [Candidatus Latescibacterota bacterium]